MNICERLLLKHFLCILTKKILGRFKVQNRIVCSYRVTYAFQSESTLYICLNVKELLAQSRREIWSLSDCNWTRTHNQLVRKRTLNHLAKLAKNFLNDWAVVWVLICTVHLIVCSYHVTYAFLICTVHLIVCSYHVTHVDSLFWRFEREHLFSTYAKFSEKLIFLNPRTCAYQGVRNVSFSENFAYVLNEWSQTKISCS